MQQEKETIRQVARHYFGNTALGWDSSLERLADKLDADGISYYEYFAYLLNAYADTAHRRGTRNSLKVYSRYKEYREHQKRHAELNAYLDNDTFEAHIKLGESPETILTDSNIELTPLFRYVMALTVGLYSLAPQFQKEAVLQLKENTEYFRTFAKFKQVFPVKEEGLK